MKIFLIIELKLTIQCIALFSDDNWVVGYVITHLTYVCFKIASLKFFGYFLTYL